MNKNTTKTIEKKPFNFGLVYLFLILSPLIVRLAAWFFPKEFALITLPYTILIVIVMSVAIPLFVVILIINYYQEIKVLGKSYRGEFAFAISICLFFLACIIALLIVAN